MASFAQRDTDADWRRIGEIEPHWGVLTDARFKQAALDAEALDQFYASGRSDIGGFVGALTLYTGWRPGGRALDFGCGVGRLAEAMTEFADEVTGYDISPGMLARARARAQTRPGGGVARFTDTLPDGPFDWINSFIVFQHIPPERGMALLQDLLGRLAMGGAVSLHFTVDRSPQVPPASARVGGRGPVGEISMFDYDLTALARALRQAGVSRLHLAPTDHGGHLGYIIFGRRETPPAPPPLHAEGSLYLPGERVPMGPADDPRQQLTGFSGPEAWGRWTEGDASAIRIRHDGLKTPAALRLWVVLGWAPPGEACRVRVSVAGHDLGEHVAEADGVLTLPLAGLPALPPGELEIALQVLRPKRPEEAPAGDGRALGVALAAWAIVEEHP